MHVWGLARRPLSLELMGENRERREKLENMLEARTE